MFHFSCNTFARKTWELKNASAEFEIEEKNRAFSVMMPNNGVSLFFLGNASDKYQRQNEAYDKQEQNLQ